MEESRRQANTTFSFGGATLTSIFFQNTNNKLLFNSSSSSSILFGLQSSRSMHAQQTLGFLSLARERWRGF